MEEIAAQRRKSMIISKPAETCPHQWGEEIDTCRNCGKTDLGLVPLESNSPGDGVLRPVVEPLHGSYCFDCDDFTLTSPAQHCALCGAIEWTFDLDDEIFG